MYLHYSLFAVLKTELENPSPTPNHCSDVRASYLTSAERGELRREKKMDERV